MIAFATYECADTDNGPTTLAPIFRGVDLIDALRDLWAVLPVMESDPTRDL